MKLNVDYYAHIWLIYCHQDASVPFIMCKSLISGLQIVRSSARETRTWWKQTKRQQTYWFHQQGIEEMQRHLGYNGKETRQAERNTPEAPTTITSFRCDEVKSSNLFISFSNCPKIHWCLILFSFFFLIIA